MASIRYPRLPTWSRRLAVAILATWMAVATVADEDRRPVLLRSSRLLPPAETTGTGLAPELGVRVEIDVRGKVAGVEVLAIDPPSEYDDVFRHHTVAELSSWRFAPAIVNGRPVATHLEWKVQFKASQPSGNPFSGGLLPSFLYAKEDAEARHARLLSLPVEKQAEILNRYSNIAEKHLDRERRKMYDTERFVVVTDAESPELAGIVARNLEVSLNVLGQLLQSDIEPQPSRLKFLVYIYTRRSAFQAMREELFEFTFGSATYYAPGLIVYHLEVPSADYLQSSLIHEACHAYSDRFLRRPGFAFPRWLEEGFAEYMGNSQIKKGKLIPGRTLKRQYVLNHFTSGARNQATAAGWDLQRVQQALSRGEGLTFEELVSADRDVFYGGRSHLYYGTSWLLVHFLRHGEPGWEEESFPRMMLYMAEGYPAKAALETAYGHSLRELEAPFLEYVKKF